MARCIAPRPASSSRRVPWDIAGSRRRLAALLTCACACAGAAPLHLAAQADARAPLYEVRFGASLASGETQLSNGQTPTLSGIGMSTGGRLTLLGMLVLDPDDLPAGAPRVFDYFGYDIFIGSGETRQGDATSSETVTQAWVESGLQASVMRGGTDFGGRLGVLIPAGEDPAPAYTAILRRGRLSGELLLSPDVLTQVLLRLHNTGARTVLGRRMWISTHLSRYEISTATQPGSAWAATLSFGLGG